MKRDIDSYSSSFYVEMTEFSGKSNQFLARWIFNTFSPKSAIDWGAGLGDLANELLTQYSVDVKAIEGEWVREVQTKLPGKYYEYFNLNNPYPKKTRFDIAICLEVAEHLDEKFSDNLIRSLCASSDIIVFSAAIPNQGGTNHLNEQWPNYWSYKFYQNNYIITIDPRLEFWEIHDLAPYYRQNLLVFERNKSELKYVPGISLVHPMIWDDRCRNYNLKLRIRISKLVYGFIHQVKLKCERFIRSRRS